MGDKTKVRSLLSCEYDKIAEANIEILLDCAIGKGAQTVKYYLCINNIDINCTNTYGKTALMLACETNEWSAISSLIGAGADVNQQDRYLNTPLMYASQKGHWECFRPLSRALKPLDVNRPNGSQETALTLAVHAGCVDSIRCLLRLGANIDVRNALGWTPLMIAAFHGHFDCAHLLFRAGANIHLEDNEGRTPLMLAARYGHVDCLKLFLQIGANIHHRDLLSNTPLMLAAEKWEAKTVLGLFQAGADINAFNSNKETALMLALKEACYEAETAEDQRRSRDTVRILLDAGADFEVQDLNGLTALMIASCLTSDFHLCQLLNAGANIDQCDPEGNNVLMHALEGKDCTECVDTLINSGIDVNIPNKKGRTALMLAARGIWHGKYVEKLLAAGANVNHADSEGRTALMHAVCRTKDACSPEDTEDFLQELITAVGANINMRDKQGNTALTLAAEANKVTCVASLVRAKSVNMNSRDNTGKTALMHVAIIAGQYPCDLPEARDYLGIARLLLDNTGDVNVEDNEGLTATMHSCASKHGIAKDFINHLPAFNGLERSDHRGRTAMVHALQRYLSLPDRNYQNYGFLNVQSLLAGGVFPVLSKEYRPLGELAFEKLVIVHETVGIKNIWDQLTECEVLFAVSNGIMAPTVSCKGTYPPPLFTPLLDILQSPIGSLTLARYLLANCYVSVTDLQQIRCQPSLRLKKGLRRFLRQAVTNPWPLVKLAFVAVSTAIGPSPGRDERIHQTGLPDNFQECLRFQRPEALLHCPRLTRDVPVFFDMESYLLAPSRYPLLYNWPFGHKLTLCNCLQCDFKDKRFRRTRFTYQDNRDVVLLC